MPQQPNDPVLNGFVASALLLSLTVVLYLIAVRMRGPVLRYQPRKPVPWGAEASILVVLSVLMALVSPWVHDAPQVPALHPTTVGVQADETKSNPADVSLRLVTMMIPQLLLVGGFVFVVAVFSHATPRDLGMPANAKEFASDVSIGVVASLAALAPVHAFQALLMYLMGMPHESGHQLVKMLMGSEPNLGVLLLASLIAVVVAPVCEEMTFRLLFQGWLEKWEDNRLGWRVEELPVTADQMTNDECLMTNEEQSPFGDSTLVIGHSPLEEASTPPQMGVAGLPYGWLPIVVSSTLFALAHFGYGPEPVPLFFLALVLGFVYQRTHRIVPCIVAHALFNLFTIVVLWRMVYTRTN